jgi:AraC-like DNA-binding protein
MFDEHDRLAIRAIIEAALPHHLTRAQIAKEAGTRASSTAFKRKFEMYEGTQGGAWLEAQGGETGKEVHTIRAGVIAS